MCLYIYFMPKDALHLSRRCCEVIESYSCAPDKCFLRKKKRKRGNYELGKLDDLNPQPQVWSTSLQVLPANFLLLSLIERLTNQGSLGGIDALLGCPLHLPSSEWACVFFCIT